MIALILATGSDCQSSASGVKKNPLGRRAYERETPDAFPKVSPMPTTYVVRQAVVDENDGKPPVTVDYRYGKYQVDAEASRSLGFAWRESLNELSKILTRSEMVQDARTRPGVAFETSCVVDTDALLSRQKDALPTNLCPAAFPPTLGWGRKISESDFCWNIVEGDDQGKIKEIQLPAVASCARTRGATAQLSQNIVRQSSIWKSVSISYELDGQVISKSTDTFTYDSDGGIQDRHGNVVSTLSTLDDGTSVETINEYSDNPSRWLLGRLD